MALRRRGSTGPRDLRLPRQRLRRRGRRGGRRKRVVPRGQRLRGVSVRAPLRHGRVWTTVSDGPAAARVGRDVLLRRAAVRRGALRGRNVARSARDGAVRARARCPGAMRLSRHAMHVPLRRGGLQRGARVPARRWYLRHPGLRRAGLPRWDALRSGERRMRRGSVRDGDLRGHRGMPRWRVRAQLRRCRMRGGTALPVRAVRRRSVRFGALRGRIGV
ncbi:MAG: hypothetical protein NZ898_12145 [Myxococcota bacterium]|nr:hypothetical protein [Myxococcota bacterium]